MKTSLALTLAASLVLLTPALATDIRVPADQPDLKAALAASAPGDVILVQTSINQAAIGSVLPLYDPMAAR